MPEMNHMLMKRQGFMLIKQFLFYVKLEVQFSNFSNGFVKLEGLCYIRWSISGYIL